MWKQSSDWGWHNSESADSWYDDHWKNDQTGYDSQSSYSWSQPASSWQEGFHHGKQETDSSWKCQEWKSEKKDDPDAQNKVEIMNRAQILHNFLSASSEDVSAPPPNQPEMEVPLPERGN